ncbi:MAG: hypothetical protein HN712_21130 [Gemmatimonadetes bacterium]|nr:hypothetical protein [Gemmatimonadota bacterium]
MTLAIDEQFTPSRGLALELPNRPGRLLRVLAIRTAILAAGVVLTVLLAVRMQLSLLSYQAASDSMSPDWLAVAGGLMAGGLILGVALLVVFRTRSMRRAGGLLLGVPLLLLVIGCLAMTYYPRANFKSDDLRAEWTHLHPTLRHALWVARLSDESLVLTDLRRAPDDYHLMGLRLPFTSRHFPQTDGYAHAVDLRVSDAGDLRNWARQGLFLLMGLHADRHGGTADHLHVSLPG